MNHSFGRSLLAVTGLLLLLAAAAAAPAVKAPAYEKAADRFERTKARIEALLKSRLKPTPLPATLPNPFEVPGGLAAAAANDHDDSANPAEPKPVTPLLPPGSNSEILAAFAAQLKISGTAEFNGQIHLIINRVPYKEGDLIPVTNQNGITRLRLTRVSLSELTLGLNEATQTLKVKL